MLSADPMGHVFATFQDELTLANPSRSFEIELAAGAVQVSGSTMLVGLRVRPGPGSTLDPAAIALTDAAGNAVSLEFADANANGQKNSVVLAKLSKGARYRVDVGADRNTRGSFVLDAILAGDLDGNRRVDSVDTSLMNSVYGKAEGAPGYIAEADANYDGRITSFDRSVQQQNVGDRALIGPMSLWTSLDPPPTGYTTDGTPLTNIAATVVKGTTSPGAVVTIDMDGDGTAEQTTIAGADGSYLFQPTYAEGLNTLRIRSADAFGQYRSVVQRLAVDTVAPVEPEFELQAESDSAPAGDDQTTFRSVSLVGRTEPAARVELLSHGLVTFADLAGNFRLSGVVLAIGENGLKVRASDPAGNSAEFTRIIVRTSPADTAEMANQWTAAMLSAVRLAAASPPMASRAMAMVSTAMYDAVNSVNAASTAFLARVSSPAGASAPAAAVAAAHKVLSYLFPAQKSIFDQQYAASLAQIDPGQSRDDGLTVGAAVGDIMIALRESDGAIVYAEYNPSNDPGLWRPTAPGYGVALLPNWMNVTPFAMTSGSQFRPAAPMALDSAQYAEEYNEIKAIGRSDSATRTADQTQIARFWSDGAGTYTPAGHWNQIAAQMAQQRSLTLFETLKLMAQLNVAMADASIAAWDAKFTYNQWRPITAIREGDRDGNDATAPDATWLPLVVTPPFPDYVSGHSTYSGAAARILAERFGDETAFTVDSYALPGVLRSFTSFSQAAREASDSRVYGGIHFRSSCLVGLEVGRQVAEHVLGRFAETVDTVAPVVSLLTPKQNASQRTNFEIRGKVVDGLSDLSAIEVKIDSRAPFTVASDKNGQFEAVTDFALDGTADGLHTISVRATDSASNQSAWMTVEVMLDTAAPSIDITTPENGATLDGFGVLSGVAHGTGSRVSKLEYKIDGSPAKPVTFDPATGEFEQDLDLSKLSPGNHTITVIATDDAGNTASAPRAFVLPQPVALAVTGVSPAEDSTDVGVTQRPRITFSRAINRATLGSADFFISFAGSVVPSTIVPADDGLSAWLFPQGGMPAGSRVSVTVVGDGIAAPDGQLLDADGDGTPGGTLTYSFTTVGTSDVPGTAIFGVLADSGPDLKPATFDDQGAGPDQTLMTADDVYKLPIAHVEVYILGRESQKVYTDAQGRFTLGSVPVGNVKLVVNGRTATNTPAGIYFPEMVMDLTIRAGMTNVVMDAMRPTYAPTGATGVHLPRIREDILTQVSATDPTVIGVPDEAAPDLTPQQREELKITVQPGSLVGENGQKLETAQVGLSTVPPELVRDMLPPGLLQHTFDVTIQAPGVAAFSTPLEFSSPNVFGGAPGTKLNFLSFDHTTGRLVIEGTGTVSADGLSVTTDPGTGITKPGWHGWTPPGGDGCGPKPPKPPPTSETLPDVIKAPMFMTGELWSFPTLTFTEPPPPPGGGDTCNPPPDAAKLNIKIEVSGPLSDYAKARKGTTEPLTGSSFTLTGGVGSKPHTYGFDFKTFAELSGLLGGTKANPFAKLDKNILFATEVKVTETYTAPSGNSTTQSTYYNVYRLIDATDADRSDGALSFEKALPGVQRAKNLELRGPVDHIDVSGKGFSATGAKSKTVIFNPDSESSSYSGTLTVFRDKGPMGGFAGNIVLEGRSTKKQKWYVEESSLLNEEDFLDAAEYSFEHFADVNEKVILGNFDAATSTWTFDSAKASALFNAAVTQAESKLSAFSAGWDRVGWVSSLFDTVSINAFRWDSGDASTASGPALGRADSDVGGGNDNGGVKQVVLDYVSGKYSLSEVGYRMSELLNTNFSGQIDVYLDQYFDQESTSWTFGTLSSTLGKTFAHELGHTLGMPHTNGFDSGDIMAQGFDGAGSKVFLTSANAMKMSLGLPWSSADIAQIADYFTKAAANSAIDSAHGDDPNGGTVLSEDGLVLFRDASTDKHVNAIDLGRVGDGGGKSASVVAKNGGASPITITGATFTGAGAQSLTLSGIPAGGLVIQPGGEAVLTVTVEGDAGWVSAAMDLIVSGKGSAATLYVDAQIVESGRHVQISNERGNLGAAVPSQSIERTDSIEVVAQGTEAVHVMAVRVVEGGESFSLLGVPADLDINPVEIGAGASWTFGTKFTPTSLGLKRAILEITTDDARQSVRRVSVVGTGVGEQEMEWGSDYLSVSFPELPTGSSIRMQSDAGGNFAAFLPASEHYKVMAFDPVTGLIGVAFGITDVSGGDTNLTSQLNPAASQAPDSDSDGLPDDIEFAIGTDITKPDSNSNGLDDFTEIQLGLNPLDGTAFPTGVVSSLAIAGTSKDVVVAALTDGSASQTAFIAAGSGGLAVVDTSRFNKPVLLTQIGLTGDAQDLAYDADAKILAVACGAGGIHIINVTDPSSPVVLRTINVVSSQVEILDGVVIAAVGGEVRSYDVPTGERLGGIAPSSASIVSMTRAGNFLYTVDSDRVTRAIEINSAALTAKGQVNAGVYGRLFVGGGVLYIAAEGSAAGGFATVDVSNPANLKLLSGVDNTSFGGRAIAATGSGLAVLVGRPQGGGFGNVLDLADVRDPANTGLGAGNRISLPALPYAVAIAGGMAFVADGTSGLVVVNYLAFDNLGQAPAVSVGTAGLDVDPGTPGVQVAEASVVSLAASFLDDVQLRQVDLIVNGKTARTDSAYPFDLGFALPTIAANGGTSVKVQVRATDTGGNSSLSQVVDLALVPDTTAPTLVSLDPPNNSSRGQFFRSITLVFNEPVDPATIDANSIGLTGPNGPVQIESVQSRAGGRGIQVTFEPLKIGAHALVVRGTLIKDRAGNAMGGADVVSNFQIREATAVWTNPAGGFWDDSSNWDTRKVPGPGDDVLIDVGGGVTITYRQGTTEIRSLVSKNPVTISGGTLSVVQTVKVDSTLLLSGGTLKDATIMPGVPGSSVLGSGGTLSGVTLEADLVVRNGYTLYVANGLKINKSLTMEAGSSSAVVYFTTSQSITGTGQITVPVRTGISYLGLYFNGLAVAIDVPVNASGPLRVYNATGTMTFQRPVAVFGASFQNSGPTVVIASTLTAVQSTVTFFSPFVNQGQIALTSSALTLATTFTIEQLGLVTRTGSDIFLTGTLDNTNRELNLGATIGSWIVTGVVLGGTVSSGNAAFVMPASWTLTLDGATIAATMDIAAGATLTLRGSWRNLGILRPAGGTLWLDGSFTLEKLGAMQYQSGLVRLKGVLDLAGQTLVLDTLTGPWALDGGTLRGGTLGQASLPIEIKSGTFAAMALKRSVTVNPNTSLVISEGLVLDSELLVSGAGSASYIYFAGQTVTGTGEIRLGGPNANMYIGYGGGDRTLILTPEVELRGAGTVRPYNAATLKAGGSVVADQPGQLLKFLSGAPLQAASIAVGDGALFEAPMSGTVGAITLGASSSVSFSEGTYSLSQPVVVDQGATLALRGRWTNGASISVESGELVLGGEFLQSDLGTLVHTGGRVTFSGVLLNSGGSVMIDTLMSRWNVAGGVIRAGFVFSSTGDSFQMPAGWNLGLDGVTLLSPIQVPTGTALAFSGSWVMSAETVVAGGTVSLGGTFGPSAIELLSGSGTVRVVGTFQLGGEVFDTAGLPSQWVLAGGILASGTLTGPANARLNVEGSGVLQGMTIGIAATVLKSAVLYVSGGLTLNADLTVLSTAYFYGQTISGDGDIVLGDAAAGGYLYTGYNSSGNRTLVIESGVRVRGRGNVYNYNSADLVVQSDLRLDGIESLAFSQRTVTLNGQIEVTGGADLYVSGLAGTVARITATGAGSTVSTSGTGTVLAGGIAVSGGAVATIGGLVGSVGPVNVSGAGSRVNLAGSGYSLGGATTVADAATLDLRGGWTNAGTISAQSGTTLLLGYSTTDVWTNAGQIIAPGAAVWIRGAVGPANLGAVDYTGASVALVSAFNLGGGTFTVGGALGEWRLEGGSLVNGVVDAVPGSVLVIKSGTLDSLTLKTEVRCESSVLLLNTITLSGAAFRAVSGTVYCYSTGLNRILGSGEVVLGSANSSASMYLYNSNSTLQIGAEITVRGYGIVYGYGSSGLTLDLKGNLVADASGRTLTVQRFGAFQNSGKMSAVGGGRLQVLDVTGSLGQVTADGAGSTFTASGAGYTNGGSIAVSGGAAATLNDRSSQLGAISLAGASSLTVSGSGYTINSPLATNGGAISLRGSWTNQSTVTATGGQLNIGEAGKNWTNAGQFIVDASTTTIDGTFTWAGLGSFTRTGGSVSLRGVIDNRSSIIVLQTTIGSWSVDGGRIWGGEVRGATFGYILPTGWNLTLDSATVTRSLQVDDLTTLSFAGTWDNNATLSLKGSGVLNLGGDFRRSELGSFSRTGGTVRLTGTLRNGGSTLHLDAALGTWILAGGTVDGGTVATAAGYELVVESGTFAGVRLASDLTIIDGKSLTIAGSLELAADLRLHANGAFGGGLNVQAFTNITGAGTIWLGDATSAGSIRFASNAPGPTEIGAGITIRGRGSLQDYSGCRLSVLGSIIADVPGQLLSASMYGGLFTSSAVLTIIGDAKLSLSGVSGVLGALSPIAPGASLSLNGSFVLDADVSVPAGATLALGGDFRNNAVISANGAALTLGSSGGRWKNLGQIVANESVVTLDGVYSPETIGALVRTGGELRLRGSLTTALLPSPSVTLIGVSNDWIGMGWPAGVAGADGYVIERSLSSNSGFVEIARVAGYEQEFFDTNVVPQRTYYYRVRSYNAYGVSTSYTSLSPTTTAIAASGLLASHFENADRTGRVSSNISPNVDFAWGANGPGGYAGYDDWATVLTGGLFAPESGTYTLYTLSDDGVRVYIDDVLVINNYTVHGETENSGQVSLTAGTRHRIRVEYFEAWGNATLKLSWSGPGVNKSIIPQANFRAPLASELESADAGPVVPPGSTHLDMDSGWLLDGVAVTAVNLQVLPGHVAHFKNATLTSVTLSGDAVINAGSTVYVYSNFVLNGSLTVDAGTTSTSLYFGSGGSQLISGNGTIVLSGLAQNAKLSWYSSGASLTVAPGITIRGSGLIGWSSSTSTSSTLINQGVIEATGEGLWVMPAYLTNSSTIRAAAGSRVRLGGTLNNTGVVSAEAGAVVELAGRFTLQSLGVIDAPPAQVVFTGILDNTGRTLVADVVLPQWTLANGQILDGIIWTSDAGPYSVPAGQNLRIKDADITVDLVVADAGLTLIDAWSTTATIQVQDGGMLSLGGVVALGAFASVFRSGSGTVGISGTLDALGGGLVLSSERTGDLRLEGGTLRNAAVTSSDGSILTLLSGTLDGVTLTTGAAVRGPGTTTVTGSLGGAGLFSLDGGRLNFAIAVNLDFLSARVKNTGTGRVVFSSVLDLQGKVFDLDTVGYSVELSAAQVKNGEFRSVSSGGVSVTGGTTVLDSVVLNADVEVAAYAGVSVTGSLTVERTMRLSNGSALYLGATPALLGNGSLILGWVDGTTWSYSYLQTGSGEFTIGAGIELYGSMYVYGSSSVTSVINLEGAITFADHSASYIYTLKEFRNRGRVELMPGSYLSASTVFENAGTLVVAAGAELHAITLLQTDDSVTELRLGPTGIPVMWASTLQFGGTLRVTFDAGLVPQAGDRFELFKYSSRVGAISLLEVIEPPAGLAFAIDYGDTSASLVVGIGVNGGSSHGVADGAEDTGTSDVGDPPGGG